MAHFFYFHSAVSIEIIKILLSSLCMIYQQNLDIEVIDD